MTKNVIAYVLTCALFCGPVIAQDSLTVVEAELMRYRARNLITDEYMQMLNTISNSTIEPSDVQAIIANSYSGTKNKIFYGPNIIIEDDINPNSKSSQHAVDSEVKTYLADFDVLYTKSNIASVVFSNVRASNPKRSQKNYIYLNVYFNSFFRNQSKTYQEPYTINNRVALVRMEKVKDKDKDNWVPLIEGIAFFNAQDTLSDLANDIRIGSLSNPSSPQFVVPAGEDTLSFVAHLEEEARAKARREEQEEKDKENKQYYALLERGEKAEEAHDLNTALKFYQDAVSMRPNDAEPRNRSAKVIMQQKLNAISTDQRYDAIKRQAQNEEKKRNFQEASKLYKYAASIKPEMAASLDPKIRELDAKWAIVSEMQEKLAAGATHKDLISDYDKAIKQNKGNSDLYLGRGRSYDELNNFSRALADYNQALAYDDKNLLALKYRAELYAKKADFPKALTDYKMYLTLDDQDYSVYEAMSDIRLRTKLDNYDAALAEIDAGLAAYNKLDQLTKPNPAQLYYKKGLLQAKKNQLKESILSFTSALLNDSTHTLALFNRGRSQLALNNVANASLDFESARKKGLDSQNVKLIQEYANNFYLRAAKKFSEGLKDSAVALIDYAISIDPTNSKYHYSRGEYFLSLNNRNEAINSFNRAIQLNPEYVDAYFMRGTVYQSFGNYKTAAENYQNALELSPKHYEALKRSGDAFYSLKDYKKAALNYEGFIQIVTSPKDAATTQMLAETFNSLGKSYFAMNESDERALTAFKNALRKAPDYAEAYYNKGLYLLKNKETSDAIKDFTKATSLDNKNAAWDYYLATAYQEKKDYQNAANYFNSTILKDSLKTFPQSLYLLAFSNHQIPNFQEALANYSKMEVLRLDTGVKTFNSEMGEVLLNLSKPDSALRYLNKAYQADSTNGVTMYQIAIAKEMKGNRDEALAWFEKALQSKQVTESQIRRDKLVGNIKEDKNFRALLRKY